MPKMAYFRSPQLAGKSLRRPSAPILRGSLRRKNPDGTVVSPYFAGLPSGGGTISIQSLYDPALAVGSVTIAVPASPAGNVTMEAAIIALNAQLVAIKVVAFDDGGCIGLMSSSTYPVDSWIKVTGGTAAAALGFDISLRNFQANASDLKSAPEGRIGNPFGAAFPAPGENFDSDSVSRALGRVMANMDVLHSEHVREEVTVAKIGTVAGPSATLILDSIAPGQRIFTAGTPNAQKALTTTSDTVELARFFYLMDPVTKQVAQSAVTGVTDNAGDALLGIEKLVITSAISEIPAGDVVRLTDGTAGIQVGDYAKITGADNGAWRNNGYRWVVEEVPAAGTLRLRPMSKIELEQVGETIDETQPLVELSSAKAPGETFGSISVYRSPFTTGVRLQVSPAVPSGATYDVYAAIPITTRSKLPYAASDYLKPLFASLVQTSSAMPDGVLTRPTFSTNPSLPPDVTVGEFYVRWRGKRRRIPASTVSVVNPAAGKIYFDPSSCSVTATGVEPTSGMWLLATTTTSGSFQAIPTTKIDALPLGIVTVGGSLDCNFLTLADAARYVTASGKKAIIVLMESQTLTQTCALLPGVRIEGASRSVKLSSANPYNYPLFSVVGAPLVYEAAVLSNLTLHTLPVGGGPWISAYQGADVLLQNVRWEQGTQAYFYYVDNEHLTIRDTVDVSLVNGQNSTFQIILKTQTGQTAASMRTIDLAANRFGITTASGGFVNLDENVTTGGHVAAYGGFQSANGGVSVAGGIAGSSLAISGAGYVGGGLRVGPGAPAAATGEVVAEVRVITPEVESRYEAAATVYGGIIAVSGDNFQLSPAEAAQFRPGDEVLETASPHQHGLISGIDYSTGWVGVDVGGMWTGWDNGAQVESYHGAIGSPLTLRAQAVGDGPVRVAPKGSAKADGYPIFRVARDVAGASPVLDVVRDDLFFTTSYDNINYSTYAMKDILERVVTTLYRVGVVGSDYPIFYIGTLDVTSNGGRPVIGALPEVLPIIGDSMDPVQGRFGGIEIPIGSALYGDNMDVMEYVEVEWFRQPSPTALYTGNWGAWNWPPTYNFSQDVYWIGTTKHACPSRLFSDRLNFAATENVAKVTVGVYSKYLRETGNNGGAACPLVKITLVNRAGRSLSYWYYWDMDVPGLRRMPNPQGPPPLLVAAPTLSPLNVSLSESYAGQTFQQQFTGTPGGGGAITSYQVRNGSDSGAGIGTITSGGLYSSGNISSSTTDLVFAVDASGVRSAPATVNRYNYVSGGTGGGGGGGCPAPWVGIDMADGTTKPAGDIKAGDLVATRHENGRESGLYGVLSVQRISVSKLKRLTTEDGRVLAFSPDHRFKVGDEWVPIKNLQPGMIISGTIPGVVKDVVDDPDGPAMRITVVDAHTYQTSGLLSHNRKPVLNLN